MSSDSLWTALALVLVIEGLLPFLSPGVWKRAFVRLLELKDGQLRFYGLCTMGCGLLLLWFVSGA